jgi:MFS family permease
VIPRARKTLSRFDRRVWLLLFAMLAFRFGHGLYFPFSSIYFHNVLGIPLSLVGIGLAVFAAASVLSGFFAGPLTDRYGRKPLMLTALAGSSASFFAFSLVGGFAGYLAVSAAHGFVGWSMFEASRNAMVADVTPLGMRSRAYGLVRVGGNVGWVVGRELWRGLPRAIYRNLGPYSARGARPRPDHQRVASRAERAGRERRYSR